MRVLEYLRKKYLRQAVIVGILASVCALSGVFFVEAFLGKALAVCFSGVFFCVMFNAIGEDFQTRFEGKLLIDAAKKFPELLFDIGRGCSEDEILEQSVCPKYGVYECFNVIKGKGFIFEESQFLEDVRFLGFSFPVFEGVIVRIDYPFGRKKESCVARLVHENLVLEGGAAELLYDVKGEVVRLLKQFGVTRALICVSEGAVYFWLKGAQKLYWQAGLFSYNEPQKFDKRITDVSGTGRAIADKLGRAGL